MLETLGNLTRHKLRNGLTIGDADLAARADRVIRLQDGRVASA